MLVSTHPHHNHFAGDESSCPWSCAERDNPKSQEEGVNNDGSIGQTGTMFPKNITIIPFSLLYKEELIIKHLEDVLTANEYYIKANSIDFPLMELKNAVRYFNKRDWCCVGHYYLSLLNLALHNKGYSSEGVEPSGLVSNFNNQMFTKTDGTKLKINAWAGM